MACSAIESNFLDLLTAAIMAPVQAVGAAAWLLWTALVGLVGLLWALRLPLALVAGLAVCLALPLLVAGLAATAAFAWVTYPRAAVRP